MKDIYGKLRNEHIETLKKLGDMQKENAAKKMTGDELQNELMALKTVGIFFKLLFKKSVFFVVHP